MSANREIANMEEHAKLSGKERKDKKLKKSKKDKKDKKAKRNHTSGKNESSMPVSAIAPPALSLESNEANNSGTAGSGIVSHWHPALNKTKHKKIHGLKDKSNITAKNLAQETSNEAAATSINTAIPEPMIVDPSTQSLNGSTSEQKKAGWGENIEKDSRKSKKRSILDDVDAIRSNKKRRRKEKKGTDNLESLTATKEAKNSEKRKKRSENETGILTAAVSDQIEKKKSKSNTSPQEGDAVDSSKQSKKSGKKKDNVAAEADNGVISKKSNGATKASKARDKKKKSFNKSSEEVLTPDGVNENELKSSSFSIFQLSCPPSNLQLSSQSNDHDEDLWKLHKKRAVSKVEPIAELANHVYPHRVKVYPENTNPRKQYKTRVVGQPERPDFSISDSDSDSDSEDENPVPSNALHEKVQQFTADQIQEFEQEGIKVKDGKWDVVDNKLLAKRLKKLARKQKMSFEDVQGTWLSEPFSKNKEFWWSLAKPFPQRTLRNIYYHTRRVYDEKNYQGQWDETSDMQLLTLVEEYSNAWSKIGEKMGRLGSACHGRYRLIANKKAGNQNKGTWTDEEIDLLIKTVNKYKSEMKITKDEDISWKYVSEVFKGKRNLLQLRHKWHVISPYVQGDKYIKPSFEEEDRRMFRRVLIDKLKAGRWEHETQVPWATFRDENYTLDSEASRKLYYRMRNRITGFEKMMFKDIVANLDDQQDVFVLHDPARPYLTTTT